MGGEGSGRPLSPATIVKRIYSSPPTISQPNNLTFPPVIHLKQEALKSTPETYLLNTGDVATGNYNFDSGTFFIDATNNNVGIGTTSPVSKLDVDGSGGVLKLNETGTAAAAMALYTARYGLYLQGAGISQTQYLLNIKSNGGSTNVLYAGSDGNVGIGTTSPSQKLNVVGSVLLSGLYKLGINNIDEGLYSWVNGNLGIQARTDVDIYADSNSGATGQINFHTGDAVGAGTAKMVILNDGNVGINDTSPAEKLDVTGNINLTGVLKVDGVQVLKEQQAHIADAKTDYTTGDLDTEAEIITALNATNTKINAILLMLETHGLTASS